MQMCLQYVPAAVCDRRRPATSQERSTCSVLELHSRGSEALAVRRAAARTHRRSGTEPAPPPPRHCKQLPHGPLAGPLSKAFHAPFACPATRRLFQNVKDMERLAEYGVLFLLFEMGLELSLDRLKVSQLLFPQFRMGGSTDIGHGRAWLRGR